MIEKYLHLGLKMHVNRYWKSKVEQFVLSIKDANIKSVFDNLVATLRARVKSSSIVVTLSDKKLTRSNQQNRYFHKLVGLIAEQQGNDAERVKREIKHKIGLIERQMINSELITIIKSTADLKVDEFSALIEATISVCVFLEISYPTPDYYGFKIGK